MYTVADLIRDLQKLDQDLPVLIQLADEEGTGVDVGVRVDTIPEDGEQVVILFPEY